MIPLLHAHPYGHPAERGPGSKDHHGHAPPTHRDRSPRGAPLARSRAARCLQRVPMRARAAGREVALQGDASRLAARTGRRRRSLRGRVSGAGMARDPHEDVAAPRVQRAAHRPRQPAPEARHLAAFRPRADRVRRRLARPPSAEVATARTLLVAMGRAATTSSSTPYMPRANWFAPCPSGAT